MSVKVERIKKKYRVICTDDYGMISSKGGVIPLFRKGEAYDLAYIDKNVTGHSMGEDGRYIPYLHNYYCVVLERNAKGRIISNRWIKQDLFNQHFKKEIILRNTIVI